MHELPRLPKINATLTMLNLDHNCNDAQGGKQIDAALKTNAAHTASYYGYGGDIDSGKHITKEMENYGVDFDTFLVDGE